MDIYYFHPEGTDADSPLNIGCVVDALIQRERVRNRPRGARERRLLIKAGGCQNCGGQPYGKGNTHIHHVKPMWVFALLLVLANPPKTIEESNAMTYEAILDRLKVDASCASDDNLQVLCRQCHEKAEGEITAYWRRYFSERYPIKWGTRLDARRGYYSG